MTSRSNRRELSDYAYDQKSVAASAEADGQKGISVYRKAEKKTQDRRITVWMLPEAAQVEEAR